MPVSFPPAPPPDGAVLLGYAQATYAAVTEQRRRLARAFLIVAAVFAVVALVGAVRWVTALAAIDAVVDEPLVEALGVRIPDPRPAVERMELRLRAFGWSVVTAGAGLMALVAGGLHLLTRPAPLPPELRGLAPPGPQPPM